jgi:triacylglycerol lipase
MSSFFTALTGPCHGGLAFAAACLTVACGSAGVSAESAGAGAAPVLTGVGGGGAGGGVTSSSSSVDTATAGAGGSVAAPHGPYPFVLAHGFFGFENFAGLDFATYFYNVKASLAAQGEIVDTPAVDPFNNSEVRGAELLQAVELFVAETGAKKVNIIGHSQGGLDARVVANARPDLVASVVTISTPHFGTPVADVALEVLGNTEVDEVVDGLVKLLGTPFYGDSIESSTSLIAALQQFSQPGIIAFNAAHPNSPGVYYASFAGRSQLRANGDDCRGDPGLSFITPYYGTRDPLNALLSPFALLLDGTELYMNDGLVRVKDAKWGEFLGCVPGDHLDEIGQIFGENPGLGNNWKYLDFYSSIIKYMRAQGF